MNSSVDADVSDSGEETAWFHQAVGGYGPPLKSHMMGKSKPFVDGGGLCSPGRWSPCARLVKPIGAQCFSSLQAVLDKHMDGRRLLLELACKKHADQPFPVALVKEAIRLSNAFCVTMVRSLIWIQCQSDSLSISLLEEFLRICGDPDASAYCSGKDSFAAGGSLGVNQKMPRTPAVFEKKMQMAFL